MRYNFKLLFLTIFVIVLAISCSGLSIDNNNDPEGTISLAMRSTYNGGTNLGKLFISSSDNFAGVEIACIGRINGVGDINNIPVIGWSTQTAVMPGCGYVFCEYDYNTRKTTFTRLYVEDYILNSNNEVLGANVRYQSPFTPSVYNHGLYDMELIMQYTSHQKSEHEVDYEYDDYCMINLPNDIYIPNLDISYDYPITMANMWPEIVDGQLKTKLHIGRSDDGNPPVEDKIELWINNNNIATITVRYRCVE